MTNLPMDLPAERDLVAGLKNRDERSFSRLHQLYVSKIYALVWRMVKNRGEAEDITQETFLQAYQKINGFKGKSRLYTWLFAIAKNKCLRHLQHRRRSSFVSLEKIIQSAQDPEAAGVFNESEKAAYIPQVKEGCLLGLLYCLSLQQRLAFILTVLLKVEIQDTAKILDKTCGATRILICRAEKNLKKFLCKNCSWLSVSNPCRCENLIRFSLQKGWIQAVTKKPSTPAVDACKIEREIQALKKVAALYQSLPEPELPRVKSRLRNISPLIFFPKKVK